MAANAKIRGQRGYGRQLLHTRVICMVLAQDTLQRNAISVHKRQLPGLLLQPAAGHSTEPSRHLSVVSLNWVSIALLRLGEMHRRAIATARLNEPRSMVHGSVRQVVQLTEYGVRHSPGALGYVRLEAAMWGVMHDARLFRLP